LQVLEVESLRPTLAPALSLGDVHGTALHWREHVRANEGTRVHAEFADGWAALLSHGRVRYVTAWLTHDLHRTVLADAARAAGLALQSLPEGLRLARRGGLTFAFNFGDARATAPAPADAQFVLGEASLGTGDVCAWRDPQ
jgi:beta-galactosidase